LALARIPGRDRVLLEESRPAVFCCRHCGCVYLHESHLDLLIGFLDGGVAGEGWYPVLHAR